MTPKFGTDAEHARHRRDRDLVALEIDARRDQQSAQAGIDPRRRADRAAFDDAQIAALGAEIGAHHQEPIHALRLRGDQLGAFEIGKCRQHRVRGAADEIDLAVAQRLVGLVDRIDQLERDIEPFGFEKAELDRGFGNEIGRSKILSGYGEFHCNALLLSIEQPAEFFLRLARDFRARRVARRKFFAPVKRLAGIDQRHRVGEVAGRAALRRQCRVGARIPRRR